MTFKWPHISVLGDATVTWLGTLVVLHILRYVDMTLTRSKVKVKVTVLLNFRQLAKPCMLAAMTAAPLRGFLVIRVLPLSPRTKISSRHSFDRRYDAHVLHSRHYFLFCFVKVDSLFNLIVLFPQLPVHALVAKLHQIHLALVQVDMTARVMTLMTVPAHTSVEVM